MIDRIKFPYYEKNLNIILVMMDEPQDEINALSGGFGKITGLRVKVLTTA